MMASSESQNDLDLSKKIDYALTFPSKRVAVDGATERSNSEFNSCEEFLEYLEEMRKVFVKERHRKPTKFQNAAWVISTRFPSYDSIPKSKILEDQKLFDAILYSKMFEDEWEYARNRAKYQGEMVWVEMDLSNSDGSLDCDHDTVLICENKIIYALEKQTIDTIREEFKKHWIIFEEQVREKLIKVFGVPAIPDLSKYISDLKSSFDAVVASSVPFEKYQKMAPMTEEMKKILLDELSSLNLTPRLKQQFEFDLKLFVDRDVYYWRDRLDALRCFADSPPVGSAQCQELEQLRQKVADLGKLTASLRDEIHSTSNVSEKVSNLQDVDSQKSQPSTSTFTLSEDQIDADIRAQSEELVKKRIHPPSILEGYKLSLEEMNFEKKVEKEFFTL